MKLTIPAAVIFFTSYASAITPQIGDVTDRRTTGQFFSDLEVEMKMLGEDVSDIKYLKVDVEEAKDDTGKDLIKTDSNLPFDNQYKEIDAYFTGKSVKINLKNPLRKASTFSFKGSVSAVNPSLDPSSKLQIKNFMSSEGRAFSNPVLDSHRISITVLSAADKAKAKEDERKKLEEAAKKQPASPNMVGTFQQLFSSGALQDNQLEVSTSDPNNRVIAIKFLKADGSELKSNGWSGYNNSKTYSFGENVPKDASVEIVVATEKSILKVPFAFTSVFLP